MKKSFGIINPIKVQTDEHTVTVKRASKKLTIAKGDIRSVRHERRFFRGHVLAIETNTKTLYFKQTQGACKEAMSYLIALVR